MSAACALGLSAGLHWLALDQAGGGMHRKATAQASARTVDVMVLTAPAVAVDEPLRASATIGKGRPKAQATSVGRSSQPTDAEPLNPLPVDAVPGAPDVILPGEISHPGPDGRPGSGIDQAAPAGTALLEAGQSGSRPVALPIAAQQGAQQAGGVNAGDDRDADRYAVTALPPPPQGHWRFGIYYGDFTDDNRLAELRYSMTRDGAHYRLHSEARAQGLIGLIYSGALVQSSTGVMVAGGLAPERYAEQRGQRAERRVLIDHAQRRVTFSDGRSTPLVDGAQDRLSTLIQLGLLARAEPARFEAGRSVVIPEIGFDAIERARWLSGGERALQTPNGAIRTLHLERVEPRSRDASRIEVWLGYDDGLLPVRIRITDVGGRVLDQMLEH